MVIPVEAKLKQIVEQQRDYPWPRPEPCPRCQEPRCGAMGLWRPTLMIYACPVLLRRFRCPGCGCVMRLRPKGYFERFQASIHRIYECLSRRIVNGRYGTELSRSRQRHWMLALQRQVTAFLEKASAAGCWRALRP